ncbi:MAG TPA: hypothetical protein VNO81_13210 [Candidatus Nitrosotenuis sp.]|nr:hypothetical protein [Candidatus Nitrosotenuis sp.]
MTIQDVEELIELVRRDPVLRRRVLEALLSEELLQLPAALERLTEQVSRLVDQVAHLVERQERLEERQERLEERQERLEERQERLEERQERLEERQERLEERLARLEETVQRFAESTERRFEEMDRRFAEMDRRFAEIDRRFEEMDRRFAEIDRRFAEIDRRFEEIDRRFDRLEIRLDRVEGWALEDRYERQAYAYFGRRLRRIRPVPKGKLEEMLGETLTREDLEELFLADLVICGRTLETEREVYVVLEVSATIDLEDVERAARRAEVLRRAGLACIPAVGGVQAAERALEEARRRRVAVTVDGQLSGWDEAMAAA